jgi:hypothetical protein
MQPSGPTNPGASAMRHLWLCVSRRVSGDLPSGDLDQLQHACTRLEATRASSANVRRMSSHAHTLTQAAFFMASLKLSECVGCQLPKVRQGRQHNSCKLCCGHLSRRDVVAPELKAKVDALNNATDLDPVTKTTKTCRYVEAAFLWRVKTTRHRTRIFLRRARRVAAVPKHHQPGVSRHHQYQCGSHIHMHMSGQMEPHAGKLHGAERLRIGQRRVQRRDAGLQPKRMRAWTSG